MAMLNRQTANRDKDYCMEGISCIVDVPLMPGGDILQENQTSTNYRYTTTFAILQMWNVYHNTFQIVDYILTNLQKNRFPKIVGSVPQSQLLVFFGL